MMAARLNPNEMLGIGIVAGAIVALLAAMVVFVLSGQTARPAIVELPALTDVSGLTTEPAKHHNTAVRVRGRLLKCEDYDCVLASPRDNGDALGSISIGANPWFDRQAPKLVGHFIIVTGWFDGTCRRKNVMCLDRAAELVVDPDHPVVILKDK